MRAMNRVSVLGAGSERMRKCPGTHDFHDLSIVHRSRDDDNLAFGGRR